MQIVGREKTGLRYYTDVPEKHDAMRAASPGRRWRWTERRSSRRAC
jgi:hypothetical protein